MPVSQRKEGEVPFRVFVGTKRRNLATNDKPPPSGNAFTYRYIWATRNVQRRTATNKASSVRKGEHKKAFTKQQKTYNMCAQVPGKQALREFKKESNQSMSAFQNPDPGSCGSTTSIALDSIVDFLTECGWYTGNVRSSSSVSEEVSDVGAPRALVHIVREE